MIKDTTKEKDEKVEKDEQGEKFKKHENIANEEKINERDEKNHKAKKDGTIEKIEKATERDGKGKKVEKEERLTEKNKRVHDKNDKDFDMNNNEKIENDGRYGADEKIFKNLTPEMANELRGRGLTFYEDLGKGTFSTVTKGWCDKLQRMVAVKIIDTRKDSKYTRKCLPREIDIVRRLQHDNIIRAYEVIERKPFVCIIQEFSGKGDLLKKIRRKRKVIEREGKLHFRQLLEAMKYLKSMEVVHRDIKCENILLDSFDNVKITDFGFARVLKIGERSKTFCGSRAYLAPEIIRGQPYDGYMSDMWSAGVVLYVMTTGMMPYDDKNVKKMLEKQMQHRISYPRAVAMSSDVKQLIYDILHPIPKKRPTIDEVIRSKWLTGIEYHMQTNNKSSTESDGIF